MIGQQPTNKKRRDTHRQRLRLFVVCYIQQTPQQQSNRFHEYYSIVCVGFSDDGTDDPSSFLHSATKAYAFISHFVGGDMFGRRRQTGGIAPTTCAGPVSFDLDFCMCQFVCITSCDERGSYLHIHKLKYKRNILVSFFHSLLFSYRPWRGGSIHEKRKDGGADSRKSWS